MSIALFRFDKFFGTSLYSLLWFCLSCCNVKQTMWRTSNWHVEKSRTWPWRHTRPNCMRDKHGSIIFTMTTIDTATMDKLFLLQSDIWVYIVHLLDDKMHRMSIIAGDQYSVLFYRTIRRFGRITSDYFINSLNMNRHTLACDGCDKESLSVTMATFRDILWLLHICHFR